MDKEKALQFHCDHDFKNKSKRKWLEHDKLKDIFIAHQKDIARNATYESRTGCADTPKPTKMSKCNHSRFGCKGK